MQEQASNRPVLLRSKGVVVSDRGKVIHEGWQVRVEKMSASKPFDDASLRSFHYTQVIHDGFPGRT
ncbi:hypothetical protein [Paraburkholderia aspalathi]|uniref:hypothetical protein n=1 Tax=Paraburkholderia aspalathi TaxID=1324617 RepID=UPI001F1D6BC1|nr:hypothetical protein [Paraburkholderia aspalathi]